jgi:hypothetical protein
MGLQPRLLAFNKFSNISAYPEQVWSGCCAQQPLFILANREPGNVSCNDDALFAFDVIVVSAIWLTRGGFGLYGPGMFDGRLGLFRFGFSWGGVFGIILQAVIEYKARIDKFDLVATITRSWSTSKLVWNAD